MGIDIPDIHTVYLTHTENVVIISGKSDAPFVHWSISILISTLCPGFRACDPVAQHSTLHSKHQLIQVIDKVLKLVEKGKIGKNGLPVRMLLVNSDDSQYISSAAMTRISWRTWTTN